MIYSLQAPDGRIYDLEAPEGSSEEQLTATLYYLKPEAATPFVQEAGVLAGVKKGIEQLVSQGKTVAGTATGDANEAAKAALERSRGMSQQYADQVSLQKIKDVYSKDGLLSAAGETASQIPLAIAEQLPNFAASFAGAKTGAMAGQKAGSMFGARGKALGAIGGGLAGTFAPSYVQALGGNIERQAQEQQKAGAPIDIDVAKGATTALPQAALDVVSDRILLGGKMFGKMIGVPEKLLMQGGSESLEKIAKERLLATVAKGTATGIAGEVPTEITQQALERYQAGLSLTDEDALREYGETAYQVALLGPLGVAGRLSEKSAAQSEIKQTAMEQQRADAAAAAAAAPKPPDITDPAYLQQIQTQYQEAEKRKSDLRSQLRKVEDGSVTETADRLHNKDIEEQIKAMTPELEQLAAEYNKAAKVAPAFTPEAAPGPVPEAVKVPAPKQTLTVGDALDNPLGRFTKEELSSRSPNIVDYIDKQRSKLGKPALNDYSIEDIRDAMPGELPAAEKADLNSLIAAKSGHTGEVIYKPQDIINAAKQKNIATNTDGFKFFLQRATGENDLTKMEQPQLHSAFTALSGLPEFDETQFLPEKTSATHYSPEQYKNAVQQVNSLTLEKDIPSTQALQVAKKATGLTRDSDVQLLLQSAYTNGDLNLSSNGDFITAQPAEQAEFRVEEGFAQAEPTGFNVMRGDQLLYSTQNQDEANAKVESLSKTADPAIKQIDKSIASERSTVAASQRSLDIMEAGGLFRTPKYRQASAQHAALVEKSTDNIQRLQEKKAYLQQPVTIRSTGKPANVKVYRAKEQGVSDKAFNTREETLKYILENLPAARLNELAGKSKAPGFAKRLQAEVERRKNPPKQFVATQPKVTAKVEPQEKPEITAKKEAVKSQILPMLKKFGLGDVALQIEEGMIAEGSYVASVIKVALDANNPVRVLRHESLHGLKDLGFFTPGQWKVLENQADKVWIDKYLKQRNINGQPIQGGQQSRFDAYKNLYNNDMDAVREEAIADAFADFDVNGVPKGLFATLLQKMQDFFRALRSAFTGAGYETADDVFGKVERGELKATKKAAEQPAKASIRELSAKDRKEVESPEDLQEKSRNRMLLESHAKSLAEYKKLLPQLQKKLDAFRFAERRAESSMTKYGNQMDRSQSQSAITRAWNAFNTAFKNTYGRGMTGEENFAHRSDFQRSIDEYLGNEVPTKKSSFERGELKATKVAETKTKLSLSTEKETDPNDVSRVVISGPYADAALRTMNSQITQTSNPLEVDDVGRLFDAAYLEEFKRKGDWKDAKDFKTAVSQAVTELKYQLQQTKSGLDWYEQDIADSFKQTQKYIPSLKKPEKRALFSVIAGIMSPSVNARDNWFIAAKAYQHYEKTGILPGSNPETGGLWQGGLESANKKKQLDMFNAMLQPKSKGGLGEKGAVEWLQGDHTVAEITAFRQKYGNMGKSSTGGKLSDILPGFTAFGPKVGPFVMNINGLHEVTVDVWMTRTFNRYFGQMMGPDGKMLRAPTGPQREAIKKLAIDAAAQVGIKPYQVQSTLWFFEQQLFNKLGTGAKSYGFSDGAAKFAESQSGTGTTEGATADVGANAPANRTTGKQAVRTGAQADQTAIGQQGVKDENIPPREPTARPSDRGRGRRNAADGAKLSLRAGLRTFRTGDEAPQTHTRRSGGDVGSVRVLGAKPIAEYIPEDSFKGVVGKYGHQSPVLYEISGKDADVYERAIQSSKDASPYGASVYVYPVEDYAKMRLFMTEDGKSGFALKNDDIVSVFSGPPHKGSVHSSIQLAVQEGGRRLDAFDTVLGDIYNTNGFQIVGRMKWNDDYKPDNWDKKTFSKFNNGEPDVVYMAYNPDDNRTILENPGEYFDDPDELTQAQKDAVNTYFNEGTGYGTARQIENARKLQAQAGRLQQQGGVRGGIRLLDDKTRAKYPNLEKPVKGLPATVKVNGVDVTFGPYMAAREAAVLHAEESGIPYRQQASYHKVDPEFSKMLASSYARMLDEPNAPQVKAAYKAWADETVAQYKAMLKTGIKVEFFPDAIDTYGNPRNSILDVLNNNHLYVFPADGGFGKGGITDEQIRNNPALALTDIMISDRRARVVEVFRATHDFFGHVKEGFGFRAEGEENAFQSHVRMYSPLAARAMTAGTRGQNSEVNYGPNANFNKTASGKDTKYADQKIGLLPEWASTMDIEPDIKSESLPAEKGIVLGTKQPNAQSFTGTHYGKIKTDNLDASKYGTGLQGAEARRLSGYKDNRIKKRVYFYIPKYNGQMPLPESGVGNYVYTQTFDNIINPEELSKLYAEARGDANTMESLIVDAGYDGYAAPSMGMMVILNHNVPANYEGTKSEYDAKKPKLSLREAPDTKEFKQWFGNSKVVDADGKPLVVYHATPKDFLYFDPKKLSKNTKHPTAKLGFFSAADPSSTDEFITTPYGTKKGEYEEGANVMPLYASIKNPVTIDSGQFVMQSMALQNMPRKKADKFIEDYIQSLKDNGHDGILIKANKSGRGLAGGNEFTSDNWVALDNTQFKSAIGNVGSYGQRVPTAEEAKALGTTQKKAAALQEEGDIRFSLRTDVTKDINNLPNGAAINAAINRVTTARQEVGFVERMTEALAPESFSYFRQKALDRYNRLNDVEKLIAKQMGGVARLADQNAHSAALQSDLAAGVAASALGVADRIGGIPVYRNGYTTVSNENGTVKGAVEIFSPLAKYGDPKIYQAYQFWAGAKRGKRLLASGKEELYTPQDIALAKQLEQQYPEFVSVQKDWIKYNDGLVKYAVDTGVISTKNAAEFTRYSDYVPFYRQIEGERTIGPNIFQSISGVKAPKKLTGSEAPLADFLETVVRNTQSIIQAGMKNVAAQKAVDGGMMLQMVRKMDHLSSGPNVVTILKNGEKVSYECADKLWVDSISSLNLPELPFLNFLAAPANLLRNLVTKDPGFMLANLMRDSVSAYVTSGAKLTPVVSAVKELGNVLMNNSPEYQKLLSAGALGGYEFSRNIEASTEAFAKDLRKKTGTRTGLESAMSPLTFFWEKLEKGTEASDAATRIAIYKETLAETGNEAEAIHRALEVMNFNRKGSSVIVRVAAAAIPFLNARVQGLDVFFRAGIRPFMDGNATEREKQVQKAMLIRGMTILGLSVMYAAAISGNPDYEKQEEETKDNNWIIPMGEGKNPLKIPIPFEVGTLFKTIPERIYRSFFMPDQENRDTTDDLHKSMKRALLGTFGFNPIPQVVAPLLEARDNFSVFTQRPIVGENMKSIAPEYQVGPSTSKWAEILGKQAGMSPMMIDHVYKGYTGTMGVYAADLLDVGIELTVPSEVPKPSKRIEQIPIIKRFLADPDARGKITSYFDLKHSVDTTVRTINLLEKQANPDLPDYVEKNAQLFAARDFMNNLNKQMDDLQKQANMIKTAPIPADEKRDMLKEITKAQNLLVNDIRQIRNLIKP